MWWEHAAEKVLLKILLFVSSDNNSSRRIFLRPFLGENKKFPDKKCRRFFSASVKWTLKKVRWKISDSLLFLVSAKKSVLFTIFFSYAFTTNSFRYKKISTTIVDPTNLLARVHLLPPFKQRNDKKSFLMCVCVCVCVWVWVCVFEFWCCACGCAHGRMWVSVCGCSGICASALVRACVIMLVLAGVCESECVCACVWSCGGRGWEKFYVVVGLKKTRAGSWFSMQPFRPPHHPPSPPPKKSNALIVWTDLSLH